MVSSSRRDVALGLALGALLLAGCASNGEPVDAHESPADAPASETATDPQDRETDPEAVEAPEDAAADGRSADAPRVDIPIFPGAELVHENVLAAAVEEVWVVDAPLDEVIDFYEALPGIDGMRGSMFTRDDGGGFVELELFDLVRAGETDRATYEAAVAEAEYGPLMRLAVVTPASQILSWFGGVADHEAIPPDSTVIVFGILTG